ncbi:MAG: dockerin type I domain-containing protein [bacterium]
MDRSSLKQYSFLLAFIVFALGSNKSLPLSEGQAKTTDDGETVVHVSEMNVSQNVALTDDHAVLWGMGKNALTWVSYPLASIPYANFAVEVEVGADTAAGRWPNVAVAFDQVENLLVEKQVKSIDWHYLPLGTLRPEKQNQTIFFVFTNDFFNRKKGYDVNLKIRNVRFREVDSNAASAFETVHVSWDPNQEADLAGYYIYYGTASRRYSDSVNVHLATSRDLRLPTNQTYFLAVTAYDRTGNSSEFSKEVVFELKQVEQDSVSCDINGDGETNLKDWLAFQASLNARLGDARYRERADFNKDGKIDSKDQEIAKQSCSEKW